METCTNSQPLPRLLLWPRRLPVMRWPILIEAAELLDVDVDQLAGPLALVAPDRLGRLQGLDPVEAQSLEDAANGGRRDCRSRLGDLLAGAALTAQRNRPAQPPPAASADEAGEAAKSGRSDPASPSRRSGRPTCEPSCGQTPTAEATAFGVCPLRHLPHYLALDYAASGGHSYARSSGPPRITEASTTSASSVRTGWTTY